MDPRRHPSTPRGRTSAFAGHGSARALGWSPLATIRTTFRGGTLSVTSTPVRRLGRTAGVAVTGLAVSLGGVVLVAPSADAATGIYRNCTALHAKYKHGVGRAGARDHTSGRPVTTFTRNTRVYKIAMSKNRGLDRDRDGIACEAR